MFFDFFFSQLVKGGIEIPCTVYVQMARTIPNEACLKRYQEIVSERYAEPEEEILGSVSTIADEDNMTVLQENKRKNNKPKNPTKSKNLGKNKTRCRDIREMFAQKSQETRDEFSSSTTCINID